MIFENYPACQTPLDKFYINIYTFLCMITKGPYANKWNSMIFKIYPAH